MSGMFSKSVANKNAINLISFVEVISQFAFCSSNVVVAEQPFQVVI